ncbi:MAG: hypothetical protein ACFCU8_06890 [Thermosynechococcaceae cyanobacterium]
MEGANSKGTVISPKQAQTQNTGLSTTIATANPIDEGENTELLRLNDRSSALPSVYFAAQPSMPLKMTVSIGNMLVY